jgi:two-component system chemotaxis sensor kinase CheA
MDQPQSSSLPEKITVLIVEDDSFMGSLLKRKFEQESFSIFLATNAEEARGVLKSNRIALMLLDIVLPGMDGFSFLKELKATPEFQNIPVIITSNLGKPEEIERGLAEGASGYIIKAEASTAEIVEKVRKVLEKK